jgi:opacity protein-like surface antigen
MAGIKHFALMVAALAAMAMAATAMAQTPSVYVGVHGGKSMASTELTDTPGTFSLDGLASNGYVGGVHGGIDLQLPKSPVFVGAFAGADWGDTEFRLTAGPGFAFIATLGNSYYVGGRLGIVAHGAKLYGLAAWRQAEWSSSVNALAVDDPRGWDLGLGVEVPVAKGVILGVEGIHTQYQRAEFLAGAPPTATGIHGETDQISVLARLSLQFGGAAPSIFDDAKEPAKAKACDPKTGCK